MMLTCWPLLVLSFVAGMYSMVGLAIGALVVHDALVFDAGWKRFRLLCYAAISPVLWPLVILASRWENGA